MRRRPERLHPAAWAGPERGYRPPTPYPGFEEHRVRSPYYEVAAADSWTRRSYRYVDTARYSHADDLQRQIDEQNAKIARRSPPARGRDFEPERAVPKRVRFSLPAPRRDMDARDDLAWELAKLSIRGPYSEPSRRRCSRCGQKLRRGRDEQ
ncbi:hypothetical protein GQ53DRAFT_823507 [Thozetella sp. PMI_491]|nr:hypothetical protein GQ53DRAFT_823507 [Thozetella sp. PMI_491]